MNKNNPQKSLHGRFISYWPELLVILLCSVLLLSDISHKKGYHMDELLSFELANAEFNPWIVPTQPQGRLAKFVENELRGESAGETWNNLVNTLQDILQNRGSSKLLSYKADVYPEPVWIDRQQFINYIMVDSEDDFQYLSVYFNVKDDNHPPLHFMLLHTVSSVFKGQLTPFMGCGINLVCVLGIMILLMWLGRKLMLLAGCGEYGRMAGLFSAALYGLSAGALSTTLLIRMYAMVTFFCVALLAVHVRKLYCSQLGGQGFAKGNKLLILVTVLGFWTQYFFLFYCLILAAVTAVILWSEKRKKELWGYVRAMVTSAVIGVVVFPFSVADVFSSGRGVEALENLSSGFAGYGERLLAFGAILVKRLGVGCVAVLMTALAAELLISALYRIPGLRREGKYPDKEEDKGIGIKEKDSIGRSRGIVCLLTIPVLGYFLLAARMSPYLVDRYIMPVFPFVLLLLVMAFMTALMTAYMTVFAQLCHKKERDKVKVQSKGGEQTHSREQTQSGEQAKTGNRAQNREKNKGQSEIRIQPVLWIIIGLVGVASTACQLWNPQRYEDSYLYEEYQRQEELAREYAGYPCICIGEGVGYYENLLEFTCYERTLILSPEEFENRVEQDSIASLEQTVLLLKDGLDRNKICDIFEDTYGLYPAEILMDTGGVYGDQILLLKRRN